MTYQKCKFCGNDVQKINKTFNLVECLKCGLIFSQTIFRQLELEEIYNKLYNAENPKYKHHSIIEYEELKKGIIKLGFNRKRLLDKHLRKNSKILEIGSGIGLTGCYIKQNYPQATYLGIEIDEKISEKAKSLNLNVKQGDFSIMEELQTKYDLVIMWEVLEHIQNIKECIGLIKKSLDVEGYLIFSVPNYDKKLNYVNSGDKIFQDGPPVHLNFFRKKSIKKIFELSGYQVVKVRKKRLPYLNITSIKSMLLKIISGKYEGSTLFCEIQKK